MQGNKQRRRYGKAERALKLLSVPVQLIRADSLKLCEKGVDNANIDVVTEVNPNACKECVERCCNRGFKIVKDFRCLCLEIEELVIEQ